MCAWKKKGRKGIDFGERQKEKEPIRETSLDPWTAQSSRATQWEPRSGRRGMEERRMWGGGGNKG